MLIWSPWHLFDLINFSAHDFNNTHIRIYCFQKCSILEYSFPFSYSSLNDWTQVFYLKTSGSLGNYSINFEFIFLFFSFVYFYTRLSIVLLNEKECYPVTAFIFRVSPIIYIQGITTILLLLTRFVKNLPVLTTLFDNKEHSHNYYWKPLSPLY